MNSKAFSEKPKFNRDNSMSDLYTDNIEEMEEDVSTEFTPVQLSENTKDSILLVSSDKICPRCHKMFSRRDNLKRHQKVHLKEKLFVCNMCDKKFSEKHSLKRHMQLHMNENVFTCKKCDKGFACHRKLQQHMKTHIDIHKCEKCNKTFAQQQKLSNHMKAKHGPTKKRVNIHKCEKCIKTFDQQQNLLKHIKAKHGPNKKQKIAFQPGISKFVEGRKTALNIFSNYQFLPLDENKQDLIQFFNQVRNELNEYLMEELEEKSSLKWYLNAKVSLVRISNDYDDENFIAPHFRSKSIILMKSSSIKDQVEEAFEKINRSFEDFIQMGSGWTLDHILYLEVCCARYSPTS